MVCILKEPHHREELVCFALGSVREMLKKISFLRNTSCSMFFTSYQQFVILLLYILLSKLYSGNVFHSFISGLVASCWDLEHFLGS